MGRGEWPQWSLNIGCSCCKQGLIGLKNMPMEAEQASWRGGLRARQLGRQVPPERTPSVCRAPQGAGSCRARAFPSPALSLLFFIPQLFLWPLALTSARARDEASVPSALGADGPRPPRRPSVLWERGRPGGQGRRVPPALWSGWPCRPNIFPVTVCALRHGGRWVPMSAGFSWGRRPHLPSPRQAPPAGSRSIQASLSAAGGDGALPWVLRFTDARVLLVATVSFTSDISVLTSSSRTGNSAH